MTCRDFRLRLHLRLDAGGTGSLPDEMCGHAAGCETCRTFLEEMTFLEDLLRRKSPVEMPAQLLGTLRAIDRSVGAKRTAHTWAGDASRIAAWVIPTSVLYAAAHFLFPSAQTLAHNLLVFGGGAFGGMGMGGIRRRVPML